MRRRYRLRQAVNFDRLRSKGEAWHHPLAIMIVYPNNLQISRFGFSASKRVGKAVERNRAKRLMRQTIYHCVQDVKSGWDFLFIARKATALASYDQVNQALVQLLGDAELLDIE